MIIFSVGYQYLYMFIYMLIYAYTCLYMLISAFIICSLMKFFSCSCFVWTPKKSTKVFSCHRRQ